jgi:hypothetical protein
VALAGEPLLEVTAPLPRAQLVETFLGYSTDRLHRIAMGKPRSRPRNCQERQREQRNLVATSDEHPQIHLSLFFRDPRVAARRRGGSVRRCPAGPARDRDHRPAHCEARNQGNSDPPRPRRGPYRHPEHPGQEQDPQHDLGHQR